MNVKRKITYFNDYSDDSDFEIRSPVKSSKKKVVKVTKESSSDTDPAYVNNNGLDKSPLNNVLRQIDNENVEKSPVKKKSKNASTKSNKKTVNNKLNSKDGDFMEHKKNEDLSVQIINKDISKKNVLKEVKNSSIKKNKDQCIKNGVHADDQINNPPEQNNEDLNINSKNSDSPKLSKSPILRVAQSTSSPATIKSKHITSNLRMGLSRKQIISKSLHSKFI